MWQPAETAPKDGTHVVVIGRIHREQGMQDNVLYACISAHHEDWRNSPASVSGWYFRAPGYTTTIDPVLWAPLGAEHSRALLALHDAEQSSNRITPQMRASECALWNEEIARRNALEAEPVVITLDHHERGPVRVAVWDEATWWMGKRQFSCPDDPELGTFDDSDFMETTEQITEQLALARVFPEG